MGKTRSEDTLIINTLTPGTTDLAPVYAALSEFTILKKEIDPSSRFNIILFQDDGPNYLESFTLNPDNIILALKSLEPMIVQGNIGGGIFVALSFIIDVFKTIPEKTFRLIILTDSGSPKIDNIYIPVLENLIDHVKDMPFFIDIIRIAVDDPEEDKKLMKLATKCEGGIHEINNPKELSSILEVLALKREINPLSLIEGKYYAIPEENYPFYVNLAENLLEVETNEICSICFQKINQGLVKCPKCGIITHKICWAQWAINSNIGIPHVFRCHKCFNLIRLDKDFVEKVKLAKIKQMANVLPVKSVSDIQNYLESLETTFGPKIIHVKDPMGNLSDTSHKIDIEKIKKQESKEDLLEENNEIKFFLCPHCFKMISNQYNRCPNCHKLLKKENNTPN